MNLHHNQRDQQSSLSGKQGPGELRFGRSLIIGLTGGIATGKSTVAGMLTELGARVISADAMVHEMLRPGTPVYKSVVEEFGREILDENRAIDRRKLAQIVFNDPDRRVRLEQILHPEVLSSIGDYVRAFRERESGVLVLEIPLLIETSSQGLVDKVLVVTAEQQTQIERLKYRYSINESQALLRIKAQMPLSDKVKLADWVISTEGSIESTREQVESVWRQAQKLLAQRK
ncbi:MAG TPA: dephospho-CoA kinase [Armatimonadota bacterium]|jgi:dephospho-CoA kinase